MEIPEPTGPLYIHPDHDRVRPVCGVCPATRYPRKEFVIYSRPSWECPFNPDNGHRYTLDAGVPACVHPEKIGLEPDRVAPPPRPEHGLAHTDAPSGRGRWRLPWRSSSSN